MARKTASKKRVVTSRKKPARKAAAVKKTAKKKPAPRKKPAAKSKTRAVKVKKAKAAPPRKAKAKTKTPSRAKSKAAAKAKTTTTARPKKPDGYVPSAEERYMSQRQKTYFRGVLKDMLTSIRVNSEKTIDTLKDDVAAIPDDNDRASKEAEFTLELRERERERRLKAKVDHAIKRLDSGEFGMCEECGEAIGIERLVARPVAVFCFECKQLQERREKTGT